MCDVHLHAVTVSYLYTIQTLRMVKTPPTKVENRLKNLYYDPKNPGSFGGVQAVYRAAKASNNAIRRKDVVKWLQSQNTFTLHKPLKRKISRNRVIVYGVDSQWQADLVDMSQYSKDNNGYRYILTAIDIFSKYAWAVPLKNKSEKALVEAFRDIFKLGRKPQKLQTDKGTEFTNRGVQALLKENGVDFFTTNNETKASVVERFNRTLKSRMWKYFTAKNTHRFINVLPDLMKGYNNSFHRSIQTKPSSVSKNNEEFVWQSLYESGSEVKSSKSRPTLFKFELGDKVRISNLARPFKKGYLPKWTEEIFTISSRIPRRPPVYKVKDYDGEEIEGTFYEEELQKIIKTDQMYRIERVLKKRKRNGKMEYFVKWFGYPDKFSSWVDHIHKL